jgi:predicted nucleotidyltransferase
MPADVEHDPVLVRFKAALDGIYGDRLERVVLFGSRARGDQRADSDYDIAIFLHNPGGLWEELDRIAEVETDIIYDTGTVISAKPFPAGSYRDQTPIMREIRRDGIDL